MPDDKKSKHAIWVDRITECVWLLKKQYRLKLCAFRPQSDQSQFAKDAVKRLTKLAGGTLSWDLKDDESRSPLMLAALHNNKYLVKHLVTDVKVNII